VLIEPMLGLPKPIAAGLGHNLKRTSSNTCCAFGLIQANSGGRRGHHTGSWTARGAPSLSWPEPWQSRLERNYRISRAHRVMKGVLRIGTVALTKSYI
jgi:hypothetical protein